MTVKNITKPIDAVKVPDRLVPSQISTSLRCRSQYLPRYLGLRTYRDGHEVSRSSSPNNVTSFVYVRQESRRNKIGKLKRDQ